MPEMMNSLSHKYVNERNDNDGVIATIFLTLIIEKMEGFMKNPYSAEFPGIGPNQNGTDWASSMDAVYINTGQFDYYLKILLFVIHITWV